MQTNHTLTRCAPGNAELDFLEDRIYEHNAAQTKQDDGQLFAFLVRDESGTIVAGISGWTWAQACEIRQLWVHSSLRGLGYGQTLLERAEQEAREHGCQIIFLSSYSFQAPAFYQKFGYQLVAQLPDFPPGHSCAFLSKTLI
jgi:N-acetylglutamate synthase-like GNAT family acetyltransferase